MSIEHGPKLKAAFLIDGFNLYHSLRDNPLFCDQRWLCVTTLGRGFIPPTKEEISRVYFFTALPTWDAEKRQRHQKLLRVYQDKGVVIREGEFSAGTRTCEGSCREVYPTMEEKNTDINICLELLRIGRENLADKIYLITADSDQVASIKEFKRLYPGKQVVVIFPPGRHSAQLKQIADMDIQISMLHLKKAQLSDPYVCKNGTVIAKPVKWCERPKHFPLQTTARKFLPR